MCVILFYQFAYEIMLIVDKVYIFTEKSACGFYQFADEIMLIVDEVYNFKNI